jgi:transketolase
MRKTCLDMVYELAKADPRIFFIGSDLGAGTLKEFKAEMPERFFMEGIAEQNVVGMAAGLALEGKIVYVNTIATFLTRRAYEQVAVDVCLHKARVRLIGNGGGTVYAPLGPTHIAFEDISLMRILPGMTILCPADATEMTRLMPHTVDHPGPVYIRLGKGYDPVVTDPALGFAIGKGLVYADGPDALIVTTGVCLGLVLEAKAQLEAQGIRAAIVHLPTVKPLDAELLRDLAATRPVVVSMEENSVVGGLGSAMAELLARANFAAPKRFAMLGLPDAFSECYGSQRDQMTRAGLTAENLTRTVAGLCGAQARG